VLIPSRAKKPLSVGPLP